jgi:hypothetical protein
MLEYQDLQTTYSNLGYAYQEMLKKRQDSKGMMTG